ncbi:hypothetical protein JT321_gp57 [Providencia phage Kokobel1]|uniref:Uncharacterized protein n=1 Tax=Providencia phage Kokobel1 TaxID=2783540 RepID=A0A873WRW3_9CAUD|nr:hypothetical protein JT321_gp57 [Providencia phage Kokobel1]QPB11484.1 hypothetical protein [Providencia phage Kokobel1]
MTFISNVFTDNSPFSIPETIRPAISAVKPAVDLDKVNTLRKAVDLISGFDNFTCLVRYMFESVEVCAYDHGAAAHMENDADLSAQMIAVMKALGYSFDLDMSHGATTFKAEINGDNWRVMFWQHGEDSDNWDITFTCNGAVTLRRDDVPGMDALIFAAFDENFNPMNPIEEGLEALGFEVNNEATTDDLTVFSATDGRREIHVSKGLNFGEFTAVYLLDGKESSVLSNRPAHSIITDASAWSTWVN